MKIATWNVNSVRKRSGHIQSWLEMRDPDALCVQETKVRDEEFPAEVFKECGYEVACHGQPGYNGVAIASRSGLADVERGLPGTDNAQQARLIAATVGEVRLLSVYVPNGNPPGSPKYSYKLGWLETLAGHLAKVRREHESVVAAGDYNVAPEDGDVFDIGKWGRDSIAVTPAERQAHGRLADLGFADAHRATGGGDHAHTWWDYRSESYRRNRGLRIDHVLLAGLQANRCEVDREPREWQKPSDHAPVVVHLS